MSYLEVISGLLSSISLSKLLEAGVVLALTYLAVRFSNSLLVSLGKSSAKSRLLFGTIAPVFRFSLWMAGAFSLIVILAPSENNMLALLASFGLALGIGGQDLVRNLIGGLVILVDRPYQLGDRVKIGDAYGEIDHVGLRSTKLTTPDDTRVTIPNSELLSQMAWNANSGSPDCQVVTDLYLPTATRPDLAIRIGYEAAYSSPYLLLAKPVVVNIQDRFTEAPFLQVRVKAYVFDHRLENRFISDVTARAKEAFLRRRLLDPESWASGGSRRARESRPQQPVIEVR